MTRRKKGDPAAERVAAAIMEEFSPKTAEEAQEALRSVFGPMIETMLKAELEAHLGYPDNDKGPKDGPNRRNGYTRKVVRTSAGEVPIDCVLSSSRRQNRRYDFDTFGVSRADLFFYSRDLPSISAFSILLLAPPNSTSLPWCMMRSMMAEASLSSPNTTPHLLNSIFVVITRLRFS